MSEPSRSEASASPWNEAARADVDARRARLAGARLAKYQSVRAFLESRGWDEPRALQEAARLAAELQEADVYVDAPELAPSPSWTAASSPAALMFKARKSAETCQGTRGEAVIRCGCGFRRVTRGCEHSDCVICARRVGEKRARRAFHKIRESLDVVRRHHPTARDPRLFAMRVTVFTIPPRLRPRYTAAPELGKLRRALWALLRDEFGAAWACAVPHPVGDENPDTFHPHLNLLWAAKNKLGTYRGKLDPADLERLKDRWAELLGCDREEITGAAMPAGDELGRLEHERDGRAVLWHGFVRLDQEGKLLHRATYFARVFAGWRGWMPKSLQWFGEYARGTKAPPQRCECCGELVQMIALGDKAAALWRWIMHNAEPDATAPPELIRAAWQKAQRPLDFNPDRVLEPSA